MAEFFALLAALCFATSHILIRRGLETSNSITASLISLGLTALTTWIMIPFLVPASSFRTPAIWYFIAAGIFAPGLGRMLNYMGIERVGVARAVPVSNSSPMFASLLAVFLLGERWTLQNFLGTSLVIGGLVILAQTRPEKTEWRRIDLIYPILSAISFGISSNLRKLGLTMANLPVMAAAVAASTAFLFVISILQAQGGRKVLRLSRASLGWFFVGGLTNSGATLAVFYALSLGKVVVVEPLVSANPVLSILLSAIFLRDLEAITSRVVIGAICTVAGTLFVVTA
jgi:uncharacterized membrane protein